MTGLADIAHVILAGGQGLRMGGADKALLTLGGRPLIAHVADRLGRLDAVSANGDPARLAWLGVPVLPDAEPGLGPLAGILAALDWAAGQGFDAIVTAPADTPSFPAQLPGLLAAHHAATGAPVVVAAEPVFHATPRWQPVFGLWSLPAAAVIREALAAGERRLQAVAVAAGGCALTVPGEGWPVNINTPDDLVRAEARLAGLVNPGCPARS